MQHLKKFDGEGFIAALTRFYISVIYGIEEQHQCPAGCHSGKRLDTLEQAPAKSSVKLFRSRTAGKNGITQTAER